MKVRDREAELLPQLLSVAELQSETEPEKELLGEPEGLISLLPLALPDALELPLSEALPVMEMSAEAEGVLLEHWEPVSEGVPEPEMLRVPDVVPLLLALLVPLWLSASRDLLAAAEAEPLGLTERRPLAVGSWEGDTVTLAVPDSREVAEAEGEPLELPERLLVLEPEPDLQVVGEMLGERELLRLPLTETVTLLLSLGLREAVRQPVVEALLGPEAVPVALIVLLTVQAPDSEAEPEEELEGLAAELEEAEARTVQLPDRLPEEQALTVLDLQPEAEPEAESCAEAQLLPELAPEALLLGLPVALPLLQMVAEGLRAGEPLLPAEALPEALLHLEVEAEPELLLEMTALAQELTVTDLEGEAV